MRHIQTFGASRRFGLHHYESWRHGDSRVAASGSHLHSPSLGMCSCSAFPVPSTRHTPASIGLTSWLLSLVSGARESTKCLSFLQSCLLKLTTSLVDAVVVLELLSTLVRMHLSRRDEGGYELRSCMKVLEICKQEQLGSLGSENHWQGVDYET